MVYGTENVHQCCCCGEIKTVEWIKDPFIVEGIHEVSEDDPYQGFAWWCEKCYDNRWDDV